MTRWALVAEETDLVENVVVFPAGLRIVNLDQLDGGDGVGPGDTLHADGTYLRAARPEPVE